MTRDEVLELIRCHLADELEVDPARDRAETTRFREDLEADSLDLYTLVQELEDTYGVKMSDEQAAQILTVGEAVDFVLAHAAADTLTLLRDTARRAAGGSLPAGLHARVVVGAAQRLLRAAGLPRRLRAGAVGHGAPLPAPGGRALRRRAADEDPRAGGVGPGLPGGGRAARSAGAAARRGAGGDAGRRRRAASRPSACWRRCSRR